MLTKTTIAITLGIIIPIIVISFIGIVICVMRRMRMASRNYGYNKVKHDLDDEEIEFKKMLDSGGGSGFEDPSEIFSPESLEDFEFSSKDRDRLNLLENFRNNLMTSAEYRIETTGNTADKREQSGSENEADNDNIRL